MTKKRAYRKRQKRYEPLKVPRTRWLIYTATVCLIIFVGRLFQLQVLDYDHYATQAQAKHVLGVEIPARRGEIYVRDYHTGELSLLATNISLDLLYVDPVEVEDPVELVESLTPFIFDAGEYRNEICERNVNCREAKAEGVVIDILEEIEEMSEEDLKRKFKAELLEKISVKEYDYVVLARAVDEEVARQIVDLRLSGIFTERREPEKPEEVLEELQRREEEARRREEEARAEEEGGGEEEGGEEEFLEEVVEEEEGEEEEEVEEVKSLVWANPILVSDPRGVAEKLAPLLDREVLELESSLTRRKVRYVVLANKIPPEVSAEIRDLGLRGVALVREHWRYYPEGSLASKVLGFVNREGYGQYGLEGSYNIELEGQKGLISAETDRMGRLLPTHDPQIRQARDGDKLILTLDRNVQAKVEKMLERRVVESRADGGQVIVMDPWTGAIIALAEYPGFDPNNYGDVYERRELFTKDPPKHTMEVMEEGDRRFVYKNEVGPKAYRLRTILDIYEPGSTFKSIAMASAINAGVVEPTTRFYDGGPIQVDEYTIHNAEHEYYGWITMLEVLKFSLNTGMTFVARQMGGPLFYEYIVNFGFGSRTEIEFDGEEKGQLEHFRRWAPTELVTKAFGQGIATTPIQMVAAYGALANGGYLLRPHVVAERVEADGTRHEYEREVVRRAISEETSEKITAMLVTSVRSGAAKPAGVDGYLIAGKTGTSQIAKGGRYEEGEGSTIASFAGFAPADDPRFVVLVKIDRPRVSQWGATNAAPLFKEVAEYLFDYYGISPKRD